MKYHKLGKMCIRDSSCLVVWLRIREIRPIIMAVAIVWCSIILMGYLVTIVPKCRVGFGNVIFYLKYRCLLPFAVSGIACTLIGIAGSRVEKKD